MSAAAVKKNVRLRQAGHAVSVACSWSIGNNGSRERRLYTAAESMSGTNGGHKERTAGGDTEEGMMASSSRRKRRNETNVTTRLDRKKNAKEDDTV